MERISALGITDGTFAPRPLPVEPFANSIGVYSGPTERVELEFDASVTDFVTSRDWHKSQTFEKRTDGTILMRLDACLDLPLRTWVLGFGGAVRVVAPLRLAQDILEQIEQARVHYMPRLTFDMLSMSGAEPAARSRRLPRAHFLR